MGFRLIEVSVVAGKDSTRRPTGRHLHLHVVFHALVREERIDTVDGENEHQQWKFTP